MKLMNQKIQNVQNVILVTIIFLKLTILLIVFIKIEIVLYIILNIIITMMIIKDGKNALMVAYIVKNMAKVLKKQIV